MMRAKMEVRKVMQDTSTQETIEFSAVTSNPYGPNGESEDNTYARWTPMGLLSLSITNPDLIGKFKPGDRFYVDFTPAAE
ncbi:MAG TPA: hypothetical protein VF190_15690 [Rhodothermales bacterium]